MTPPLLRNDVRQYAGLAHELWRPGSPFAMLHWIAAARAALVPPAEPAGSLLVDLGCGGGSLAPYAAALGYRHVGLDLEPVSLGLAEARGVVCVRADVAAVPLRDGCAAVVSAGQILEHVPDPSTVVSEACRLLRPGGLLVVDTINATVAARILAVEVAERVMGPAVRGIHDPELFVPPQVLVDACARQGLRLAIRGIRPAAGQLLRWLVTRRGQVRMVPTRSTAVLYQGWGVKEG